MPRKRIHTTAAEIREAKRLKAARYYAKKRDAINAKRRANRALAHTLSNSDDSSNTGNFEIETVSEKRKPRRRTPYCDTTTRACSLQELESGSSQERGRPLYRESCMARQESEYRRPNNSQFLYTIERSSSPENLEPYDPPSSPDPLDSLGRQDQTHGQSQDRADSKHGIDTNVIFKGQQDFCTRETAQESYMSEPDTLDPEPDTLDPEPDTLDPEPIRQQTRFIVRMGGETAMFEVPTSPGKAPEPSWLIEAQACRDAMREVYASVGATNRHDFLPAVLKRHLENIVQGRRDLIQDIHDTVTDIEDRIIAIQNLVYFRLPGVARCIQRFRDRVTDLRGHLGSMVLADLCSTADLVDDYEKGRLPYMHRKSPVGRFVQSQSWPMGLTRHQAQPSSCGEKQPTKGERKMIDKITLFTSSQKRYLDQYINLYAIYRDSRTDTTHLQFWRYMTAFAMQWLRRWSPPMWAVWRKRLRLLWKRRVQERIIRYYDWKLGGVRGLRKLERNWTPKTPPPSPAGRFPAEALTFPAISLHSPPPAIYSPPRLGRNGPFRPLFND
ncbi:hypothetical protein VNI00_016737 [Paramarasmius palmivorus]|uniref:Uncharacterized protein n=1 Tax=Paramarasmius palmivorus TaxID=297713 RepID=A0AAW0BBH0_9AGAR